MSEELYMQVTQYGVEKNNPSLNATVAELLASGLKAKVNEKIVLSNFILETVDKELLKDIIDGQA